MPVSVQDPISAHTGNGVTTTFPFGFLLALDGDLEVFVNGVNVSGYVVIGLGNEGGGSVIFNSPPAFGARVLLVRSVVLERLTEYQYAGDFKSPTVNLDFDRIWMALQDAALSFTRALRFPKGDAADGLLPAAPIRANTTLGFDEDGALALYAPGGGPVAITHQANVISFGADPFGILDSTEAFAAAFATGKQVIAPAGTFRTGQLVIPDGASFTGAGERTIIKPVVDFSTNAFWVTPAGATGIELSAFSMDLPVDAYPNTVPIYVQAGSRHHFHDILMPGGGNTGVLLVDNKDTTVERVEVLESMSFCIQSQGTASRRNRIDKCFAGGSRLSHNIQCVDGKDHSITNCASEDAHGFGINMFRVNGGSIENNRSGNSHAESINATDCNHVHIRNNRCLWDTLGVSGDFGISVAAQTPGLTSIGIKVQGNTVMGSFSSGIALASTNFGPNNDAPVPGQGLPVEYCDVSGNTIINCGRGGGTVDRGSASGVVMYGGGCQHNKVHNNNILNNVGTMDYGVAEFDVDAVFGTPSNNRTTDNFITGANIQRVLKSESSFESLSSGVLPYSPTIAPATGAFVAATVQSAFYYEDEKVIDVNIQIAIPNNGDGNGAVRFTLPRSAQSGGGAGRENGVTGKGLIVICQGTEGRIYNADGSYPGVNGAVLVVQCRFFR